MARVRFQLMGEFRCIDSSGQTIEIALSKEIALIAILALSKESTCARSRIVDLLWSDRCAEQGRSSLRHSLWSLKKILNPGSPGLLEADRRRVILNPDLCCIDVARFMTLAASKRQEDNELAVDMYAGDLLETLVVRDREWESWLGIERNHLQIAYAECLYRLSRHYLLGHDVSRLMGTGLQLIAHNPLWEVGHRALMQAYALTHQKSRALKQFEGYRDMVHRELNSRPEPEIQLLYERIKGDRLDSGLQAACRGLD